MRWVVVGSVKTVNSGEIAQNILDLAKSRQIFWRSHLIQWDLARSGGNLGGSNEFSPNNHQKLLELPDFSGFYSRVGWIGLAKRTRQPTCWSWFISLKPAVNHWSSLISVGGSGLACGWTPLTTAATVTTTKTTTRQQDDNNNNNNSNHREQPITIASTMNNLQS